MQRTSVDHSLALDQLALDGEWAVVCSGQGVWGAFSARLLRCLAAKRRVPVPASLIARTLGLQKLSDAIHQLETALTKSKTQFKHGALKPLEETLHNYLRRSALSEGMRPWTFILQTCIHDLTETARLAIRIPANKYRISVILS